MDQSLFTHLPQETIIDILSRLPVRSVATCKCVCKSWLNLLNTPEFVNSHLTKSAPGLVIYHSEIQTDLFTLFEFEDRLELEQHELHYNPVTKFDLREFLIEHGNMGMEGSADGFLFLRQIKNNPSDTLYVFNPITREYLQFLSPVRPKQYYPAVVTYGFGVSKLTGHHKVVWIFHDCIRDPATQVLLGVRNSACQVYTLETGAWRRIDPGAPFVYSCRSNGAFLNGKLHWLVSDLQGCFCISCMDLETDLFTTFSTPCPLPGSQRYLVGLVAFEGCLCLCDNTSDNEIVIWIMKEYAVEKSWVKEFVISKVPDHAGESYEVVYPLKLFEDGDILMCWWDFHMFYYCNKTKSTQQTSMFQLQSIGRMDAALYTPSFLSLKRLAKENVSSF